MTKVISVFGGTASGGAAAAGGGGSTAYQIAIKNTNRSGNKIMLTADRPVATGGVYPVFVRYKINGRNGAKGSDDKWRPRKSKWFAFKYGGGKGDEAHYDHCTMLQLEQAAGLNTYEVLGRLPDGGRISVAGAIIFNFTNDSDVHLLCRPSSLKDRTFTGFNNCGIALADKYGRLLSNVARMKIVFQGEYADERSIRLMPMYDK